MILLDLFLTFLKIGAFTFGGVRGFTYGGSAVLPNAPGAL